MQREELLDILKTQRIEFKEDLENMRTEFKQDLENIRLKHIGNISLSVYLSSPLLVSFMTISVSQGRLAQW